MSPCSNTFICYESLIFGRSEGQSRLSDTRRSPFVNFYWEEKTNTTSEIPNRYKDRDRLQIANSYAPKNTTTDPHSANKTLETA
jgi:hypothetical protein